MAVRILGRGVKRVTRAVGMVLPDGGARLDRIGVDPIVDELDRDDVFGVAESGVGRFLAAHHQRHGDVVGRLVPHRRRPGFDRILGRNDRRQRFVLDLDQFGGVPRLLQGFRHHERDPVADCADLVACENCPERAVALRSAHVFRHDRLKAPSLSAWTSAPVRTAITPAAALARLTSMLLIRAWACGDITTTP